MHISDRFGPKTAISCGAVFLMVGYSIHTIAGKDLWQVLVALGVSAVGTALVYSTLSLLIVMAVPAGEMAAVNGVNVLLRTTGSTMCSAVVATTLAAHVVGNSGTSARGFSLAYLICAGCAVVVFAVVFALPTARRAAWLPAPGGVVDGSVPAA